MMGTTKATLSALAQIDSGTFALAVDETIYPERAVRSFVSASNPHYRARAERNNGVLRLEITAVDFKAARLQIGNALSDLLMHALRERA